MTMLVLHMSLLLLLTVATSHARWVCLRSAKQWWSGAADTEVELKFSTWTDAAVTMKAPTHKNHCVCEKKTTPYVPKIDKISLKVTNLGSEDWFSPLKVYVERDDEGYYTECTITNKGIRRSYWMESGDTGTMTCEDMSDYDSFYMNC